MYFSSYAQYFFIVENTEQVILCMTYLKKAFYLVNSLNIVVKCAYLDNDFIEYDRTI